MIKKALRIIVLATLFAACSPVEYDHFGNITGTVIDVDTGEPVQQATVTLSPTSKNTYTGMDGMFEFQELEAQKYTISVQKTGYQANRKDINVNAGETANVTLVMKKQ